MKNLFSNLPLIEGRPDSEKLQFFEMAKIEINNQPARTFYIAGRDLNNQLVCSEKLNQYNSSLIQSPFFIKLNKIQSYTTF